MKAALQPALRNEREAVRSILAAANANARCMQQYAEPRPQLANGGNKVRAWPGGTLYDLLSSRARSSCSTYPCTRLPAAIA